MNDSAKVKQRVRVGVAQPVGPDGPSASETDLKKITALIEKNVQHICTLVKTAGKDDIDIVCFPEDVCGLAPMAAHGQDEACFRASVFETVQDVMAQLCAAAGEAGIYVVGATYRPEGDKIYNIAFLIGPDGKLAGLYRKTHLPPSEDRFMIAGTDYPVFDTRHGRVGLLICWDLMFPETTRMLALNGAELIFCPTLGFDFGGEHMGEMRMRVRAFDNAVYLATSSYASPRADGTGRSCIVGPQGEFLADAGHLPDKIVWADVTPTQRPPDPADPEGKDGLDMWSRWARSRRPHTYGKMVETR